MAPSEDEKVPARRASIAAPAAVGVVAAVASALAAVLNIWDLPITVSLGITGVAATLAGVLAWATTGPRTDKPALDPAAAPPPAELPPVIAHFTGRDEVLTELHERFRHRDPDSCAVVSLYGQGGVGKSALASRFAHEIARDFPDGQLYFDLRGADTPVRPEEVLVAFLRALGVRLTTEVGGLRELQKLWWTWTSGRRVLIFLDNAQDADQVRDLIPTEPDCGVIITSRRSLLLRNTYDRQLGLFTEAQGVSLLAKLAGDGRFAVHDEAASEIVRLCDRLPLAISICGGRLATRPHWSLRDLADRLADERRRLDQLEVGTQLGTSVRASLQLSYEESKDIERRLLRLLAMLTAPDVQEWVAGDLLDIPEPEGADLLDALVNSQLAESTGRDATGRMRYKLHDLVRLFAAEQNADSPAQRRAALERVLYGYRRRAEKAAEGRWPQDWSPSREHSPGPSTTLPDTPWPAPARTEAASATWFTTERLGLLAALHQARTEKMWEHAVGAGRAFCSLCHSLRAFWSDWADVADIAVEAAQHTGDQRALAIALLDRSAVVGGMGRFEPALADARQALTLLTAQGETWWTARALRAVGMTLFNSGNLDRGQAYFVGAIAEFKAEGDRWWAARTQRNLGELLLAQRQYAEARELLEESLSVFAADRNSYSEAQTQRALGEVLAGEARALLAAGDKAEAERKFVLAGNALNFAVRAFRDRREAWEEARSLRASGEIGDPGNRLAEYRSIGEAKEKLTGLGDAWGVARTLVSQGRALERLGRVREAPAVLRQAVDQFEELGDLWWLARSLRTLAEVLLRAGRPQEALDPARRALDLYETLGNEAGSLRAREVLESARREVGEIA